LGQKLEFSLKKGMMFITQNLRRSVTGLINPVARGQHVSRGDIRNEKASLNPFPGKAELQRRSNFENL
jgi:hypothetical protein